MAVITFKDANYSTHEDETVLDCLIRHDTSPPFACQSGLCHTCMMRASEGMPPASSQNGLKETLRHQHYFLPCVCIPTEDLTVVLPDESAAPHFETRVLEKNFLTPKILQLRLTIPEGFSYISGQFLNLFKNENLVRSYSIASVFALDDYIELHIEKVENGKMSVWLFDEVKVGETLKLSEALGECYYLPGYSDKKLMMIATGSGLAPIYGVLRDALNQGHEGEIYVYHGASNPEKMYLVDELKALAEQYKNVHYIPCLSRGNVEGFEEGRASEVALAQQTDLKNDWRLYICGHPDMVKDVKRKAYLADVSISNIFADPFEFST